jgi:FkbM family methyltransferase
MVEKTYMEKLISKIVRIFFSEQKIWEIKNKHHIPSMEWTLLNIKKLGFNPDFAIDVGAFDGEWTAMFKKIFPAARMLMVEAQPEKEQQLKSAAEKMRDVAYYIGLLGAEPGKEVIFNVNSTVSSVLEEYKVNTFRKEPRKIEALDDIVPLFTANLKPANFLKLDVQGYELEVLKGAPATLKNIEFILCEVSLLEINKNCPLIADVLQFMAAEGFVTYDICSFIRRPLDNALWQIDILFIRKGHPLIQNKHWA